MLEHYLRPMFQKIFIDKVAKNIGLFFSANQVSLFALLFGLMVPLFLIYQKLVLSVLCLIVSGYLDSLDGSIARLQNKASPLGAVIDIVCDRIVEFSVIFGLYLIDPISRSLTIVLMLGSILICITSFLVVGVFVENHSQKSFFYSRGLVERFEAFVFFALMIVFPKEFSILGYVFIGLVFFTAVERLYRFFHFYRETLRANNY